MEYRVQNTKDTGLGWRQVREDIMHLETVLLKDDIKLAQSIRQALQIADGEEVTVIYSPVGVILLKPPSTLTDLLASLLPTASGEEYEDIEYEEYLLEQESP